MRCERCHGSGMISAETPDAADVFDAFYGRARMRKARASGTVPTTTWCCPDCNGSGVGHCCDGLQAQCEGE